MYRKYQMTSYQSGVKMMPIHMQTNATPQLNNKSLHDTPIPNTRALQWQTKRRIMNGLTSIKSQNVAEE